LLSTAGIRRSEEIISTLRRRVLSIGADTPLFKAANCRKGKIRHRDGGRTDLKLADFINSAARSREFLQAFKLFSDPWLAGQ
ncbi:MAG: hypothetical protein ACJ8G3_22180, partial [Burkholderiaceae bacterium]